MSMVFYRGMVVDIVNSVSGLTLRNKSIEDYRKIVNAPHMSAFPRNTAIVKPISEGLSQTNSSEVVCYPFFSSHLCMPLKPGECVWFVYENPDVRGSIAYWMTRTTEPNHAEDTNYTFFARSYRQSPEKKPAGAAARFNGEDTNSTDVQTFSYVSPTSDPAELAETINFASQVHRYEAVPRYNKRPGDLVIQGSNNSLIMLGEERGHFAEDPTDIKYSANKADIPAGLGAIDIVVGRGKISSTSGRPIKNELGLPENDKRQDPPVEGDPHFPTDASRIYLTANSSDVYSSFHPDKLLQISLPSTAGLEESLSARAGSFLVGKADNIRLVSRKTGDIRIVKEPTPGEIDSAAIVLHRDGTAQVSAKKISISRYNTDGATEPYVRYTELSEFLTSLMQDLQTFCSDITPGASAAASTVGVPPGSPIPQVQTLAAQLTKAITTLQASMQLKTQNFQSNGIKSTLIFGE